MLSMLLQAKVVYKSIKSIRQLLPHNGISLIQYKHL